MRRSVWTLLWKEALLAWESKLWTAAELLLPLVMTLLLLLMRGLVPAPKPSPIPLAPFQVAGNFSDVPGWYNRRRLPSPRAFERGLTQRLPAGFIQRAALHFSKDDAALLETAAFQELDPAVSRARFLPFFVAFCPENPQNRRRLGAVIRRFLPPDWAPTQPHSRLNISDLDIAQFLTVSAKGFATETVMAEFLSEQLSSNANFVYLGGIVFESTSGASELAYRIRLPHSIHNFAAFTPGDQSGMKMQLDRSWQTDSQFPHLHSLVPRNPMDKYGGSPGYWKETFLSMQFALASELAKESNLTSSLDDWHVSLQRTPYPPAGEDRFNFFSQKFLGTCLLLSFIYLLLFTTYAVVREKEARLKEYMQVMGLRAWEYWLSHFITSLIKLLIIISILTLLLCCPHPAVIYCDASVLLLFLLIYGLSAVASAFAVAAFFRNAKSAALFAGVAFLLTYSPFFFLRHRFRRLALPLKVLAAATPNTAMAFAAAAFGNADAENMLGWAQLGNSGLEEEDLSLGGILAEMLISTGVLFALAAYGEGLLGPDGSLARVPWFPFLASYWCGSGSVELDSAASASEHPERFEGDPPDACPTIVLSGLTKTFGVGSTKVRALRGLSARIFPSQVTALLGHNGAGKSTTVSILTGLQDQTAGSVSILGLSTRTSMPEIQSVLGLCPQYNALFNKLTVTQHLYIFARLKGKPTTESEVTYLLRSLNMEKAAHKAAGCLSGGQKRKLSLAIALVGDSQVMVCWCGCCELVCVRVVVLDEPTSGVDPSARQEVWRLIQAEKTRRTILLTTHHMDEADLLADRILILKAGQLQCGGSPLFLKSAFGSGYKVSVLFSRGDGGPAAIGARRRSSERRSGGAELLRLVRGLVPSVPEPTEVGLELSFALPASASAVFPQLFAELEANQTRLGVESLGVSVTTMEDVFLKTGQAPTPEEEASSELEGSSLGDEVYLSAENGIMAARVEENTGTSAYLVHGLVELVPPLLLLVAILVNATLPGGRALPPLQLSLAPFPQSTLPLKLTDCPTHFEDRIKRHLANTNVVMSILPSSDNVSSWVHRQFQKDGKRAADRKTLVGLSIDCRRKTALGFFNNQGFHTPAIALNLLTSVLLNVNVSVVNAPLPPGEQSALGHFFAAASQSFVIGFFLTFGLCFLAASFCRVVIRERELGVAHLEELCGLHPALYWLSNFLVDFACFCVSIVAVVLLFIGCRVTVFGSLGGAWAALGLLLAFAWASLPVVYVAARYFHNPGAGFIGIATTLLLCGMFPLILANFLFLQELESLRKALDWVAILLCPPYSLASGLTDYYLNTLTRTSCKLLTIGDGKRFKDQACRVISICCEDSSDGVGYTSSSLSWQNPGIGRQLFFLFIQGYPVP